MTKENRLGTYLKDRRTKLDPAALGFPLTGADGPPDYVEKKWLKEPI